MCGIVGIACIGNEHSEARLARITTSMAQTLAHRGPDHQGIWVSCDNGIALGHRRLSIIDLSPDGRQPMVSRSGRFVIVFNGEIYNFKSIRAELESLGVPFRGKSDTEVLLAAIDQWGVENALQRCAGMFALAVWDRVKRQLHLGRDRMGEKPLYYTQVGSVFVFASELKPLTIFPGFSADIDRVAIASLVEYGYIRAPRSIYASVKKVMPGTLLCIRAEADRVPMTRQYWSLQTIAEESAAAPFPGTPGEAVEQLDALLRSVVKEQSIADVPRGALLSGGIDSSAVVAISQQVNETRTRTFSIGFEDPAYDESGKASAIARHLGTDHTELMVSASDAQSLIPRLPTIFDEPLGDSSQIPTFLVSQLARRSVTVALSGDGGDEVFGGYDRYLRGERLWQWWTHTPSIVRRMAGHSVSAIPSAISSTAQLLAGRFSASGPLRGIQELSGKLGRLLLAENPPAFYRAMTQQHPTWNSVVNGDPACSDEGDFSRDLPDLPDFMPRMQYLDSVTYLPDDILAKVDRASMAVGLELRVPLLDFRCVQFAWRLPPEMKVRNGVSKWVLRQIAEKYIPPQLLAGPKRGFSIPLARWLRGPLRNWANDLLSPPALRRHDLLNEQQVTQLWREHSSGLHNHQNVLWSILTLQSWYDAQKVSGFSPSPATV
jgi:asparagine synthase (glutamine-hydrolysing)